MTGKDLKESLNKVGGDNAVIIIELNGVEHVVHKTSISINNGDVAAIYLYPSKFDGISSLI
jgi:hypothetical protein